MSAGIDRPSLDFGDEPSDDEWGNETDSLIADLRRDTQKLGGRRLYERDESVHALTMGNSFLAL
jgi:hypothetical protein